MTAPSAEVLKNMIDNLEGKLDDHAKVHERIIDLIEGIRSDLKESNGWKNKFMGAVSVIVFIVFPILSWALWQVVHIDERIDRALAQSMEEYLLIEGYDTK